MLRAPATTTPLIEAALWDRAAWLGVAFLGPRGGLPPRLGLLFRNERAAAQIFEGLRGRLGPRDVHGLLRVAFLEGHVPGREPGYTVLVGEGREPAPASRTCRARDSGALAAFKACVAESKRYLVMPIIIDPDRRLRALDHLAIEKQDVELRRAEDTQDRASR